MTTPDPPEITTANAPAHIIAAAVQDIAKQNLPGHDIQTVTERLMTAPSVIRAAQAYARARGADKTERGAVRDSAIEIVRRYRALHSLL